MSTNIYDNVNFENAKIQIDDKDNQNRFIRKETTQYTIKNLEAIKKITVVKNIIIKYSCLTKNIDLKKDKDNLIKKS